MVGPGTFTSVVILTRSVDPLNEKPFYSGNCLTRETSRQAVAKQALFYMIEVFQFYVFDINYNPAISQIHKNFCESRKQAFLAARRLRGNLIEVHNPYLRRRRIPLSATTGQTAAAPIRLTNQRSGLQARSPTSTLQAISVISLQGEGSSGSGSSVAAPVGMALPPKKRNLAELKCVDGDRDGEGPSTRLCLGSSSTSSLEDGVDKL